MKVILNEKFANKFMVTQCGKIFKKDVPTEIPDAEDKQSFEVAYYLKNKVILPFSKEKKEVRDKYKKQLDETPEVGNPTIKSEE